MNTADSMTARVAAKVNLSLKITGRSAGLHTLDMLAASVDLYDEVTLVPSEGRGRVVRVISGPDGFDENRFVAVLDAALQLFEARYGPADCMFEISKGVPPGAGLGGSSASLAGMMLLLARYKNIALDTDFLLSVGSDVPFMSRGGFARVTGVGEIVEPLPFTPLRFVLALPRDGVDSAAAYGLYDATDTPSFARAEGDGRIPQTIFLDGAGEICLENDLYLPAEKLNPELAAARDALELAGAERVVMTGSGSGMIAVCRKPQEARRIAERLRFDGGVFVLKALKADEAVRIF